jgi:uncharacterized membrane protein YbaN (DUF454 family)
MRDGEQPELPDFLQKQEGAPATWKRVLWMGAGVLAIIVGIILWLTPLIGGAIPFYILGAVLLAKASDRARTRINGLERKLPYKLRRRLRHWQEKFRRKGKQSPDAPP